MAYLVSNTSFGEIEYDGDDLSGTIEAFNEEHGTGYEVDDVGWLTSSDYSYFSNLEVCGEDLDRTLAILSQIENDQIYAAKIAYLMEEDSVDMWDAWRLLEDGNCPDLYCGDAEDYARDTLNVGHDLHEYTDYYRYGQDKLRDSSWSEFNFDGTTYTIGGN